MKDFVVPHDVQPSLIEVLRIIRQNLKDMEVPLLKDMRSVKGIQEGTSAFHVEEGKLYRYTKVDKKLFKEAVEIPDIPVPTPEVESEPELTANTEV